MIYAVAALYLLGMVIVIGENTSMPNRALLAVCVVWPVVAFAALLFGTLTWMGAQLRK